MNYTESKKVLDKIRADYSSAGDVVFRAALSIVVECGQYMLSDDEWYNTAIAQLNSNKAYSIIEKLTYECARELALVSSIDLLRYIQKEVWLGKEE